MTWILHFKSLTVSEASHELIDMIFPVSVWMLKKVTTAQSTIYKIYLITYMILDPDLRIGYFEYLISAEYYYEATYKMFLSNFSNITSKSFYNF